MRFKSCPDCGLPIMAKEQLQDALGIEYLFYLVDIQTVRYDLVTENYHCTKCNKHFGLTVEDFSMVV